MGFKIPKCKKVLVAVFGGIFMCAFGVSGTVTSCGENRTETCIQNLDTFINLDKPRFSSETELERLCREAEDGQRCSSVYLGSSSCILPEDKLLISLQIGRSQAVSLMICNNVRYVTDPAFRKLYIRHESCIDEHQREIKECFVSSGITGDPEFEIVRNSSKSIHEKHMTLCCPLVQYIECTEDAIGRSCGSESKEVVLRILKTAAGKQLEDFCINVDPGFPTNPAACVNSSVQQVASFTVYFAVFFMMLAMHVIF